MKKDLTKKLKQLTVAGLAGITLLGGTKAVYNIFASKHSTSSLTEEYYENSFRELDIQKKEGTLSQKEYFENQEILLRKYLKN
jgi:hypothetical protein